MTPQRSLKVTAGGDREIVMTRAFDAPRHLVFDALTKPELLKRWLGVRGGWQLAECEIDLRVGGRYRYFWRHDARHAGMGAAGVYLEIVPPEKIVSTEKFDDAWYPGEAVITNQLAERDGVTTLTMTMRYESQDARDTVLRSPMESGVADSFDTMAELLATQKA